MKKLIKLLTIALCLTVGLAALSACNKGDFVFDWNQEILIVQREAGSGTRDAVESSAMLNLAGKVHSSATDVKTTGAMRTFVGNMSYAIGYMSIASLDDSVKALKLGGVEANNDNIKNGTYAFQRPFLLITSVDVALTDMSALAQDFYKYIMSNEGQNVIKADKLAEKTGTGAFTKTALAGDLTLKVWGSTSVSPVMEKLAEAYKNLYTGVNITIEVGGTGSGDGRTEADKKLPNSFGMVSSALSGAATDPNSQVSKYKPYEIALDGVAVVVNKNNPLTDLTKQQMTDIFEGVKTGYNKWSAVKPA